MSRSGGAADVLEEVLELVRGQQRLLSTPETLLPEDYLKSILLKGAGSYKPRPSSFAFYPSYKEFNRVLAARVSFATSEIVAVSGGHYPRGSLTDPDVLSQWADHTATVGRVGLLAPSWIVTIGHR